MKHLLAAVLVIGACSSGTETTTTDATTADEPTSTMATTTTTMNTTTTTMNTTTSTMATTTTESPTDARAEFFDTVDPAEYEGMTEDDVWTLVEGYCQARGSLSAQEVIDQTLAETGGLIDLTLLSDTVETLGTCK